MINIRMETEIHVYYPSGLLIAIKPSLRGFCGSAVLWCHTVFLCSFLEEFALEYCCQTLVFKTYCYLTDGIRCGPAICIDNLVIWAVDEALPSTRLSSAVRDASTGVFWDACVFLRDWLFALQVSCFTKKTHWPSLAQSTWMCLCFSYCAFSKTSVGPLPAPGL